MKRTPKYVGLDVHQATTVTAVLEESGRVVARSVVPTEATAIVAFCRSMRGAVHVALEEGTQAQWLYDVLAPVVAEVVVCDRRGQGSHGSKADVQQRTEWLRQLPEAGARFRAHALYTQLEVLQHLRPQAKAALLREAQRDRAWTILRTIPFLGPVRVALLLATMQTPWRFRTTRNLWAYAGLAVVTRVSAEYELHGTRAVRDVGRR